jgi:hypothetical protein
MYQGGNQAFASPSEVLTHISEQAWSDFTKADYTIEQWHAACLIHIHDGEPTSKSQCKLPVKTPDGALNRNGVHAAAAALAGARGGLKGVSADQKKKAGNALKRYYAQLDETPPESLSHHGVKGQKWGVRKKEEPVGRDVSGHITPASPKSALSAKQQFRIEKFQKRSDVMSTRISELKLKNEALQGTRNPIKLYTRALNKQDIKDFDKAQKQALQDAEAVQKGKLTSTQKKAIVGAVAVSGILVVGVGAVVVTRGQQSGALNSFMLRGSAYLRGQKVPFNVNDKLSGHMSADELLTHVVKPVNPGYSTPGGKMNCRRATYAYELRRRGFDVHATTSAGGWGQSESGVINAVTPGSRNFYRSLSMSQTVVDQGKSAVAGGDKRVNPLTKILLEGLNQPRGESQAEALVRIRANRKAGRPMGTGAAEAVARKIGGSQRVFEELAKQPEGSRGEVLFKFPNFGHSMAYEIVDGVPHIFDSQKGTFHDLTKTVEDKWGSFNGAEITRLDNANLDLTFLTRWATNVGDK